MRFVTDDDIDWRRSKHTVIHNVPPCTCKERATCCRKRRKIRRRRTSHKPTFAILRQTERLAYPAQYHFLQLRRHGRHDSQCRILIPSSRQPICRERRREGSAVYEAKVSAASGRYCSWRTDLI